MKFHFCFFFLCKLFCYGKLQPALGSSLLCKRLPRKEKHGRFRARKTKWKTKVVKRRAGYKGCCKGYATGKAKYLQTFGEDLAPAQRGLISLKLRSCAPCWPTARGAQDSQDTFKGTTNPGLGCWIKLRELTASPGPPSQENVLLLPSAKGCGQTKEHGWHGNICVDRADVFTTSFSLFCSFPTARL